MPRRPIRWTKSDNIKRLLSERRVEGLLAAFRNVGSKAGPWPERDPDEFEAWWRAVLHDPARAPDAGVSDSEGPSRRELAARSMPGPRS